MKIKELFQNKVDKGVYVIAKVSQMPSNFRRILQRRRALRRNPSGFRSAMRIRRGMTIGKGWSLHGNSGLD